jgi:molybdenum cofactor biosynthesis enzyme MoaA
VQIIQKLYPLPGRPDFPLELLPRLLEEAQIFGVRHVTLTGGEPHLHTQFIELVSAIVRCRYTWNFVSNGQQTQPYLPVLERYGSG